MAFYAGGEWPGKTNNPHQYEFTDLITPKNGVIKKSSDDINRREKHDSDNQGHRDRGQDISDNSNDTIQPTPHLCLPAIHESVLTTTSVVVHQEGSTIKAFLE